MECLALPQNLLWAVAQPGKGKYLIQKSDELIFRACEDIAEVLQRLHLVLLSWAPVVFVRCPNMVVCLQRLLKKSWY